VDEVEDDRDGDVAAGGLGGDPVDLMVVAVDEGDPGALVLGVAAGGLVEDRGDDVGGGVGDADGEPLVPGDRSRGPAWGGRLLVGGGGPVDGVGGDDVAGLAYLGGDGVDGADLGHALAVAFLSSGQPGGQLAAGRGLGGGLAQPIGAHDHARGVGGQDQHVPVGDLGGAALGVEVVHVDGGPQGQLLQLPTAQPDSGEPGHRVDGRVERAPAGLDRGQAPLPVRVLLRRQVECRVGRVRVALVGGAVGQPGHRHLAKQRGQRPGVPPFHP
jgi:hypothetical protein